MKARPILFRAEMIKAILDGRKVQTRRTIKANRHCSLEHAAPRMDSNGDPYLLCNLIGDIGVEWLYCPYGRVGDRLWCRETFAIDHEHGEGTRGAVPPSVYFRATDTETPWTRPTWRPSIFMPRAASRITLELTAVRVERLHAITPDDAEREGIPNPCGYYCDISVGHVDHQGTVNAYATLWDEINGVGAWQANPWIWVLSFQRVQP